MESNSHNGKFSSLNCVYLLSSCYCNEHIFLTVVTRRIFADVVVFVSQFQIIVIESTLCLLLILYYQSGFTSSCCCCWTGTFTKKTKVCNLSAHNKELVHTHLHYYREFWAEDTRKHVETDRMLATNYRSDQRVDIKRKTREQLEREAEEKKTMEALEVCVANKHTFLAGYDC